MKNEGRRKVRKEEGKGKRTNKRKRDEWEKAERNPLNPFQTNGHF